MQVRYVLARFGHSVFVLLAVVIAVFVLTEMVGDPARLMLPPDSPREQYLALRTALGLDDPAGVRLGRYLLGLAHGDFGVSLWQRVPALPVVLQRLPATLYLAGVTMLVVLPLSVALGLLSARAPRSVLDRLATLVSFAGLSAADFWVGLVLVLVFAILLRWLPTSGFGGWQFVLLPALTLALRPIGRISQVVRSSTLDELAKAYVTTARSKGLAEGTIAARHVLRNAAVPTLTLAAGEMAALLNGAVVIETIFGWPGIGSLLIGGIEHRDLPLVEATVFVIALLVVGLNLVVDMLYGVLDPRVRY